MTSTRRFQTSQRWPGRCAALGALPCCVSALAQQDQAAYPPPLIMPMLAVLGVIVLMVGAWCIFHFFFKRPETGTASSMSTAAGPATPAVSAAPPSQSQPMQRWLRPTPSSSISAGVLSALAQLQQQPLRKPPAADTGAARQPDARPRLLQEQGLAPALKQEVGLHQQPGRTRRVTLHLAPGLVPLRLPADVEAAAFWIAREAIANALRHPYAGGSPIQVQVHLEIYSVGLRLEVQDLGTGLFGAPRAGHATVGWPRDLDQHPSVLMMRQRALAVGARLTLRSEPYVGTRLVLRWLP